MNFTKRQTPPRNPMFFTLSSFSGIKAMKQDGTRLGKSPRPVVGANWITLEEMNVKVEQLNLTTKKEEGMCVLFAVLNYVR